VRASTASTSHQQSTQRRAVTEVPAATAYRCNPLTAKRDAQALTDTLAEQKDAALEFARRRHAARARR